MCEYTHCIYLCVYICVTSQMAQWVKNPPAMQGTEETCV